MSIPAAVAELNKEIAALDKTMSEAEKKKSRLVSVRDSLLKEESGVGGAPAKKGKPGRKPGATKKAVAGKKVTTSTKTSAPTKTAAPKKRVMSPEAKKKIGDAARKRWAAKKAAGKAA